MTGKKFYIYWLMRLPYALTAFLCVLIFQIKALPALSSKSKTEQKLMIQSADSLPTSKRIEPLINLAVFYRSKDLAKSDSIRILIEAIQRDLQNNQRFKVLVFLSDAYRLNGNLQEYFNTVQQFHFFDDLTLSAEEAFIKHQNLAYYFSFHRKFAQALVELDLSWRFAKELKSFGSLAVCIRLRSKTFMLMNDKDSSLILSDKAIQFSRKSGNKQDLALSFHEQAKVYEHFGLLELAVAKNLVAYQLAISIDDKQSMAIYALEIGKRQLQIKNAKEAKVYFDEALRFAKSINDERSTGLAWTYLAEVERLNGNPSKSLLLNDKALPLLSKIDDQEGRGTVHNHMGLAYKELKAFPLAINQFNLSLSFFNQIDINDKKAEVYLNLATIYQGQHQYQTALRFLNKSLGIQKSTGSLLAIYQCYRVMSEVYKVLGNETKSLYYLEKYVSLNDAQATLQTSKKIAELSELYHSEQRDRLISIQADNLEKQLREKELAQTKVENISLRNDLQKYIIVGFFILIVFIVIVGFNRHQRRMIQQKSKDIEMAQTLLRTQMNPHFIFNAMSVIQSYIYENDVKNSSKFLVSFSRLMRLILENSPKEFISIETEIEILTKYLETQKLRFEDRFEYVLTCSDELHFQKATIPPMITQPFIENAIEHGQLHAIEGGKIEINFSKNENMLHITITDNGVGRKAAEKSQKIKSHTSMALKITQQRIENLNLKYKSSGFIRIRDLNVEDETGTSVLISIPYEKEEIDQMA